MLNVSGTLEKEVGGIAAEISSLILVDLVNAQRSSHPIELAETVDVVT